MAFRPGHLRYFIAVADEGQMTRAAAKLYIAQPALSQAIAQLECDVGFELLERHARGVRLTPAGRVFLEKARVAVEADEEAVRTGQALARAARGTIELGFVGAPPGLDSPGPLARFAREHPEIDIRYRELPFPGACTSRWLSDVDVAVSHVPPADEHVWTQLVRTERRAVVLPRTHRLADRGELSVDEVLDETFIGSDPSIAPSWVGFWNLDAHRGGAPARVTPDRTATPQEVLAALAVRSAVATVPRSASPLLGKFALTLAAIPLEGAEPATFVISGPRDRPNPLVDTFLEFVRASIARAPGFTAQEA